jgi:nitrate/TMAO reductase-like tetraheme cytochrome c subunit
MRGLRFVGLLALAGLILTPVGWLVTDRLERNNDFCNACHLSAQRPLHSEIREHFDGRPPPSLAAAHALAGVRERDDPRFRCIDCHGGSGFLGRARVKALAGKDALFYALGRFDEPKAMRFPLWDADCSKCHARFDLADHGRSSDTGATPFHSLPVHNSNLGVACVECHGAHDVDVSRDAYFMNADRLRAQCARCHSEFAGP